jgi:NADP-dependent 3-hydroxy acid dehydrogenase YdfG
MVSSGSGHGNAHGHGHDFEGRRILVTGASGGIGAAIVDRLTAAGADVTATARREDRLRALAEATGAGVIAADASVASEVDQLAATILADGPPFAVINAVGAFDLAPVAETDPDMFERMIAGNLRAPFLVTRALLPAMLEAGAGHIVTIGSVASRAAFPGNGAYSASKFGMRGLHEVLVEELRGTGVRATLVEPAATDTPIWDPHDPDRRDDLPGRDVMLPAAAVADAVVYAITRPPEVHIPSVSIQRS